MKTLTALVALLVSSVALPALADCDYEDHKLNSHRVVPEWSYAHAIKLEEAPFPACEEAAEDIECEAEGLTGYGCDSKMQRYYVSCVAQDVCREAAQGWLEDDGVSDGLPAMYEACVNLVTLSGGEGW